MSVFYKHVFAECEFMCICLCVCLLSMYVYVCGVCVYRVCGYDYVNLCLLMCVVMFMFVCLKSVCVCVYLCS